MAGASKLDDGKYIDMHLDLFPIVATVRNHSNPTQDPGGTELPNGAEVFIEGHRALEYVHIEICEFTNAERMEKEKGAEFVLDHDGFVGNHYLLPLGIPATLKIVSGTVKQKFTTVAEIIDEMPRYIRVEEDIVAMAPGPRGPAKFLAAHSLHEVIAVTSPPSSSGERYILTRDTNGQTFRVRSRCPLRCTAVHDTRTNTLSKLVSNKDIQLPRMVHFEEISPYDVATWDDNTASDLLVILSGPIKMCRMEQKQFLIGWMKHNQSFASVLIPTSAWKQVLQTLELKKFKTLADQLQYIEQFPHTDIVENKLYLMDAGVDEIIWLRDSQELPFEVDEDSSIGDYVVGPEPGDMLPPLPVDEDSSIGDYVVGPEPGDMLPPLPARRPAMSAAPPTPPPTPEPQGTSKDAKNKAGRDPMVLKKLKMGFGNVHIEIRNLFKSKASKSVPASPTTPPVINRSRSCSDSTAAEPMTSPNSASSGKTIEPKIGPKPDKEDTSPVDIYKNWPLPNTPPLYGSLPSIIPMTPTLRRPMPTIRSSLRGDKHKACVPSAGQGSDIHAGSAGDLRSVNYPEIHDDASETAFVYDYPFIPDITLPKPRQRLESQPGEGGARSVRVLLEGQRGTDFYTYSVDEVVHCFTLCALTDLADTCKRERLDGHFFASLPTECLMEAPFSLSRLQHKKVNMAIKDGWRPR